MKKLISLFALILCSTLHAQQIVTSGTTSFSIDVWAQDSTGSGVSTLAYNTAGLTAYYHRPGNSDASITLATLTNATSAFSSGGFVAVNSSTMPGVYRLDVPNAALSSGVDSVVIQFKGAASTIIPPVKLQLISANLQDGTRMGLVALPNAGASSQGGLPIIGANSGTISLSGAGTLTGGIWGGINSATAGSLTGTPNFSGGTIGTSGTTFGGGTLSIGIGTVTNGLTISNATTNGNGLAISGNGTGKGINVTAGTDGVGLSISGGINGGQNAIQTSSGTVLLGNTSMPNFTVTSVASFASAQTGTMTFGTLALTNASSLSLLSIGTVINSISSIGSVTLNPTQGAVNFGTFTVGTLSLTNPSTLSNLSTGTVANVTNAVKVKGGVINP